MRGGEWCGEWGVGCGAEDVRRICAGVELLLVDERAGVRRDDLWGWERQGGDAGRGHGVGHGVGTRGGTAGAGAAGHVATHLALRVRDARIEPEAGGGAEARAGDEDAAVLERPDPLAALLVGGGEQLLE